MQEENKVVLIPVDDIIPNRFQPRLKFNEKELQSLAESISAHGIVSPIIVRKVGDKYEIIAGERRFKAANLIGLTTVPCIVKELDDTESAEVAVIENLQRSNLTPIEEARSYEKLLNKGITQEQLAKKLGVSQPTIANKIRLLNLSPEVQDALLHNKISERHARSLLQLQDVELQNNLLDTIIANRLTVRQTDDEVNAILGKIPSAIGAEDIYNVDLDAVKSNAEELIKPVNSNVDFEALLKKDSTPAPAVEEKTVSVTDSIFNNPSTLSSTANNVVTPNIDAEEQINPFQTVSTTDTFDIGSYLNQGATVNPVNDLKEEMEDKEADYDNVPPIKHIETPTVNNNASVMDEFLSSNSEEDAGGQTKKLISSAITQTRDMVKSMVSEGYNVDTEEFDFEDMYQIIIKIKKD